MKNALLIASIVILLIIGPLTTALPITSQIKTIKNDSNSEDLDPLVDIKVTVTIDHIRAFEPIDNTSEPDFFVKVLINKNENTSPIWHNAPYVDNPNWNASLNIPDTIPTVEICIQLWNHNDGDDILCDLNSDTHRDIELTYDIRTGQWTGDDYKGDPSGYGRANGCDDGSFDTEQYDCELWFTISQTDYDNDTIPYWSEVHTYGTNPQVSNKNEDTDEDGIPIEWEHHWGYNPMQQDDHEHLDPDKDSLTNWEEYRTTQWDSDPFRKDLFVELDQMERGPEDEGIVIPETVKNLLRDRYNRRNVVYHLDDGCMGGGERIPFDSVTTNRELIRMHKNYFLHNDSNNWRRSVFHYALVIYNHRRRTVGYAFVGEGALINSNVQGVNSFFIASKDMEEYLQYPWLERTIFYASVIMHETGHTLGIDIFHPLGCDNPLGKYPWQIFYHVYRNYKSCMNYRYVYRIADYSDGTHGRHDYDDWDNLDFTRFERPT